MDNRIGYKIDPHGTQHSMFHNEEKEVFSMIIS